MIIREYIPSDFIDIKNINELSFEIPSPELLLQAEIEHGKTWVAIDDSIAFKDNIVGFLIGKLKHGTPYVYNIAVAYTHRRQGIASKLFNSFEEYYGDKQKPENKHFWLQVDSDNPAQKLYFDLGYRVGYVDEDFYGKGKHALCMYKSTRPMSCGQF